MNLLGRFVLGALIGGAIGGALYLIFRRKADPNPVKPGSVMATGEQFDAFKDFNIRKGGDMFDGLADVYLKELKAKFIKNLTAMEANRLIKISSLKERDWADKDKKDFADLFKKWTGKTIKS